MPNAKRTFSGVLSGLLGLVGLSAVAGVLITAAVTPAIALSGTAAKSAIDLFEKLPGYLEVDQPMLPTTFYAKSGDDYWPMATFYDQNRVPVEYDEVSPVLYDAILSSEDPRYYEHGGIDLIGTTRALLNNAAGGDTQGGSSISQQYVKNVLIQRCEQDAEGDDLAECYTRYTTSVGAAGYERKLKEMRYAITIEQQYSKDEILLGYLNIANFGGQVYGIEAAARYYFGTTAKDLTVAQAATLAGIVQNPNTYRIDMKGGSWLNPQTGEYENSEADGYKLTKDRQLYVLWRMHEDGKITDEQYEAARAEPITPNIHATDQGCATAGQSAYFCQYVRSVILTDEAFGATSDDRWELLRRGGLSVYTTLDMGLQGAGEAAMTEWVPQSYPNMKLGATAVSLEAGTGRILAMVQNTRFAETDEACAGDPGCTGLVYASDAKHGGSTGFAPGSAYKLFTLLEWLEEGKSVNQRLNGINRDFTGFTCDGAPAASVPRDVGNYDRQPGYYGTVATFTKNSLNSGFFAMAEQLNLCDINRLADRMGVTNADANNTPVTEPVNESDAPNDPYPSVLGSKSIAPLAMASAYSAVANEGVRCEPRAIDRVTDIDGNELPVPQSSCEQVIAPNIAATAAYTLQGVMTAGGSGARSNPGDGVPVIGKTGTHQDEQTFMVESSTNVTTAVWVGNVEKVNGVYASMSRQWTDRGVALRDLRHYVASAMQRAANAAYGGEAFPTPDRNLLVTPMSDLPNVVGMSVDEATRALESAGFEVRVGDPVAGDQPEGRIQTQDPGPGRIATGTVVTINPSNGKGASVPEVNGLALAAALGAVKSAGLEPALGSCSESDDAGSGKATGSSPGAGEVVAAGTRVTVNYEAADCDGGGNGGGNGNGKGNGNGDDG